MSSRNDEEKYLTKVVATFPDLQGSFNYSDVIRMIGNGKNQLSLEMHEKEAVKHIDNSDIKEINDAIPFLLRIIEKPRMFIRPIEERVPIDQAKRINYHAVSKLSRDSSDWYSRTLVSVKPKMIYAEMSEDTLDIYENRFIVTLLDIVYRIVYYEYLDCLSKIKNAGDALAFDFVSTLYTGYKPGWSFSDVCAGNTIKTDEGYRYSLKQHKEKLEALMRRLTIIRNSELYKTLRNKKRLSGSVQRTNILMFDQNYNRAYKLWLYLHENHYDDFLVIKEEQIPQGELENAYYLYSFLCVCTCLNKMGAVCIESPSLNFGNQGLKSDGIMLFQYSGNVLELELKENCFIFRYRVPKVIDNHELSFQKVHRIISDKDKEDVDEFWFCPKYDNLENLSQMELADYTERLFDSLTRKGPKDTFNSRYALLSVNIDNWGSKDLEESLCRRIFNTGDNFSNSESPEKLELWSDSKTGIAIVSSYPFRASSGLNSISKILYKHLIKPKLSLDNMSFCPICDNKLSVSGIDAICYHCNIRISYTYCRSCDPSKQKPFYWIKYKDDSILENHDVMENCETSPLYKIDTVSKFMPICALTSFDVSVNKAGSSKPVYKFKTICPRCGIKLGEGD